MLTKEAPIMPVNAHNASGNLNFVPWSEEIARYPGEMLSVSSDQLGKSFNSGMAAVLINSENQIVGGARFIPLLDHGEKEKLDLSSSQIPDIWELGSIVSMGEARGNGFNRSLNEKLLESVRERIEKQELLILGTTKTLFLVKTLLKIDLGPKGNFSMLSHDQLSMIAPLTCVCEKPLGAGFQMSPNCDYRIMPNQVDKLMALGDNLKGKIPCTLFVSDKGLAGKTDSVLRKKYEMVNSSNPQGALVAALKRIRYYK